MLDKIAELFRIFRKVFEIIPYNYKKRIPIVLAFSILASILELLSIVIIIPFINVTLAGEEMMQRQPIKHMCEIVGISNKYSLVLWLAMLMVMVFLVKNLALLFVRQYQVVYNISIQKELSTRLLNSYLSRPYSFFLQNNTGAIAGRVNKDTVGIFDILSSFITIISEGVTVVGIVGFIFVTDPIIAIGITLVCCMCVIFITFGLRRKVSSASITYYNAITDNYSVLMQALSGIKEITIMRRRKYFLNRYLETNVRKANMQKKYYFYNMIPERMIEVLFVSVIVLLVAYRMRWGTDMVSFVSKLAGFSMGAYRLLPSMGKFATSANTIIFSKPSLDSGYNAIKEAEQYSIKEEQVIVEKSDDEYEFKDELSIRNLVFRYKEDSPAILENLQMSIRKGEAVGLIGESGAGKSTLADVILGLLQPECGGVYMDGIDIRTIPASWSKNVGYVPQSVYLIDGSIKENVAFGLDLNEIDDNKVWKVLELASLKGFVESLEHGIETKVGERGVRLSGGQRQRIAIARALYFEPLILILDEATSALDNDTEGAVMESIENLIGNITMIIVAHRLTTIRSCDHVYEITDGIAKPVPRERIM